MKMTRRGDLDEKEEKAEGGKACAPRLHGWFQRGRQVVSDGMNSAPEAA
jgi:hypothetical protein